MIVTDQDKLALVFSVMFILATVGCILGGLAASADVRRWRRRK